MVTVLVIDDSPIDRRLAGGLLERAGYSAEYAESGAMGLALAEKRSPDIVVTDMQMPGLNGLALVEAMKARFPSVPVVLMTAHGSEELAMAALQTGAASYVPKRRLAAELARTVGSVLEVRRAAEGSLRVMASLIHVESRFALENQPTAIPPIVGYLEENLARLRLCDRAVLLQVGVALREALVNAIFHGNLEVPSSLREDGGDAFEKLAEQRQRELPYRGRRVRLWVRETADEVIYTVADEGPGFDPSSLPDPTDATQIEKVSGRGLLLIRTFMDEVIHNDRGNEITLVKRFVRSGT
jgi:CheY-like chemotaxis protein